MICTKKRESEFRGGRENYIHSTANILPIRATNMSNKGNLLFLVSTQEKLINWKSCVSFFLSVRLWSEWMKTIFSNFTFSLPLPCACSLNEFSTMSERWKKLSWELMGKSRREWKNYLLNRLKVKCLCHGRRKRRRKSFVARYEIYVCQAEIEVM